MLEEVPRRLTGEACLLFEFAKCGIRQPFAILENSTRQSPFRLTTSNQQNSLASTADHGGALLQTKLLHMCLFSGARPLRLSFGRVLSTVKS